MEPSRTSIVTTLALFLAMLVVLNVAAIRNEPWPEHKFKLKQINKAFKLTNANDLEVVNAAKFACDEHNKNVRASGDAHAHRWEFENVLKAKTIDIGQDGKKIAMIISANDGPLGDFPQALVEVHHNLQTVIAFKEPPEAGV